MFCRRELRFPTIIVKSKNTYTLFFGFTAFVVAQFITPRTFRVVF